MRARVRKDASATTVRKTSVPWSVRAAATLPRGARISNPNFGEPVEGTIAIVNRIPGIKGSDWLACIDKADGALVIWDLPIDGDSSLGGIFEDRNLQAFRIEGCTHTFAANYELPEAPWLTKVDLPKPPADEDDQVDKGDMVIAPGDAGHLAPEQKPRARRVQTKDSVIVDSVSLIGKSARVIKDEDGDEERYVLGVVLEPDEVDSQGDTISAEEIRSAAHRYMEEHANVGLQHQVFVNGKIKILESYIAPVAFNIGEELVKAGTWLMAFRVLDDSIWTAIKDGLLTGLSIGGTGLKIPVS